MPSLRVREHVLHRLGQHVGRRVPDDAAALFAAGRDGPDLGVDVGRPAQIPQLAVGVGDHHDRLRLAATG